MSNNIDISFATSESQKITNIIINDFEVSDRVLNNINNLIAEKNSDQINNGSFDIGSEIEDFVSFINQNPDLRLILKPELIDNIFNAYINNDLNLIKIGVEAEVVGNDIMSMSINGQQLSQKELDIFNMEVKFENLSGNQIIDILNNLNQSDEVYNINSRTDVFKHILNEIDNGHLSSLKDEISRAAEGLKSVRYNDDSVGHNSSKQNLPNLAKNKPRGPEIAG